MIDWLLLILALICLAVSTLTVVPSPDWSNWRLAVIAGEFGHWLAILALLTGWAAWRLGDAAGTSVVTGLLSGCAAACFLKPTVQASRLARSLPGRLAASFEGALPARKVFSVAGFFARNPRPVPVETIPFGDGLAYDLYRPPGLSSGNLPCVIVVHGGGWDGGDRRQLPHVNHWLARQGYAVAAVSYRLAPAHRWPAPRDDVRAAIAHLKAHAGELGIDPLRLVLLGRSAGGQLAEVVAFSGEDPCICGVVGLYSPSNLRLAWRCSRDNDILHSRMLLGQFIGGGPDTFPEAYDSGSASRFVTPSSPPAFLIHGRLDTLVWYRHSVRFARRLAQNRVPGLYVELPWATHAFEVNLNGPGGQIFTYGLAHFLASVTRAPRPGATLLDGHPIGRGENAQDSPAGRHAGEGEPATLNGPGVPPPPGRG